MLTSKQCFIFLGILSLNPPLPAQITTDGTLGPQTNLPGPDFQITSDLGQQHGGNLFHSFGEFNINTGQIATFTGPDSVQNILTRVTEGHHSWIDGTLRSEIPNANLYLLNPSGILFGKNARLDISGSFHASTADYLRLADGSSFYARPDSNPALLSVARPEAFGFLNNRPAALEIQGSVLRVSEGKDLSLIGGDLTIQDGTLPAPGGRINLASVASSGEVIPKTGVEGAYLGVTGFKELGTVKLWQSMISPYDRPKVANSDVPIFIGNIDVSGVSAGQVFIRAGQLLANNAWILADTYGDKSGLIDISVEGPISLTNSTRITAGNLGTARQPGLINITTATKLFIGFKSEELDAVLSQPFVADLLANNGFSPAEMTITDMMQNKKSQDLFVKNVSSVIGTANFGDGIGGDVKITTPSLEVSYGLIETATMGSGKAGNIQVNASQVNLYDYGFINAAVGFDPNIPESGSGHAGNIYLRDIDGINPVRLISLSNNSTISAGTDPDTSGDAGNIDLKTQELVLTNGAQINSFSAGMGKAGSINIEADTASLTDESGIYTEADHAGGGNINLQVRDGLHVVDSKITAKAWGTKPQDNGGNITIQGNLGKVNSFSLFNSQLLANANFGHGGEINIYAEKIIGNNSQIDVSSRTGLNGKTYVNSISLIVVVGLPGLRRLEEKYLLPSRCSPFSKENLSRFIITARDILPRSPEELRTHTIDDRGF